MKEKIKEYSPVIIFVVVLICIICIFGISTYICRYPEVRNISYYGDDNYYMCNAIVGSGKSEQFHFGAIKKTDYEKWVNGENGTIWVICSNDKNRGWRLNCSAITTITIYSNDWLPLNF